MKIIQLIDPLSVERTDVHPYPPSTNFSIHGFSLSFLIKLWQCWQFFYNYFGTLNFEMWSICTWENCHFPLPLVIYWPKFCMRIISPNFLTWYKFETYTHTFPWDVCNCTLLVHWSYQERNTHATLYKYGDVSQQLHRESSLQWLHLQVEQYFWGFIRRFQVKHILPF